MYNLLNLLLTQSKYTNWWTGSRIIACLLGHRIIEKSQKLVKSLEVIYKYMCQIWIAIIKMTDTTKASINVLQVPSQLLH